MAVRQKESHVTTITIDHDAGLATVETHNPDLISRIDKVVREYGLEPDVVEGEGDTPTVYTGLPAGMIQVNSQSLAMKRFWKSVNKDRQPA